MAGGLETKKITEGGCSREEVKNHCARETRSDVIETRSDVKQTFRKLN